MFNESNLYLKLTDVITMITTLKMSNRNLIIAIDGMCASGKTTIAGLLAKLYDTRVIHMDDFFLPLNLRTPSRYEEIGGNIDYVRFKKEIIEKLDQDILYKPYNCKTISFTNELRLPLCEITIIEGSYALHPNFGEYYDLAIFVEVSNEEQIERIIHRNGINQINIFKEKWIKLENTYFEHFNIKKRTNFIIDTSENKNG